MMAEARDSLFARPAMFGAERCAVLTASALALGAVLPPIALIGLPRALGVLGPPPAGIVVVSALMLAPALAGFALALRGLQPVAASLRHQPEGEYRQSLARVALTIAAFAQAVGLGAAVPAAEGVAPSLVVAAFALVAAWLFLLHLILAPTPATLRRHLAAIADVGFLSAFLCAGGALTSGWYPVYLFLVIDNGVRFGRTALAVSGLVAAAGFGIMAMLTPFWQQHMALSGALCSTLALLPLALASMIGRLARSTQATQSANAAKNRLLAALADELGLPLETILRLGSALERTALAVDQRNLAEELQYHTRALLAQIDDLRDFAGLEAGNVAPQTESFDLHALVNEAATAVRRQAADQGVSLAIRMDPRLPWLLRGWPHQLRQALVALLGNAVKAAEGGRVRIGFDGVGHDGSALRLRISLRGQAGDRGGLGVALVGDLVALMGGRIAIENAPPKPQVISIELPMTAATRAAPVVDLRDHPMLIASDDPQFARDLSRRLVIWGAGQCWSGGFEAALAHLRESSERRPVLIVDGRGEVLQALSLADRAAGQSAGEPPFILFAAEEPWIDNLIGLADGELAAILPMPLADAVLANALHALPLEPPSPRGEPAAATPAAAADAGRPLNILVAEDNAANRSVIERVLATAGHGVQLAANGEEALAALEAGGIDLVLMDVNMPRVSGYEAARLYRMLRPYPPIIALTGDSSAETERRCHEAGMDAVLTKPIEPHRLIAAVAAAARSADPQPATVVTPIASHPRFAADNSAAVDERALDALKSLGAGSNFFRDVLEAFRADAREILADIARAAGDCDPVRFREGVHALRSCAANVGGARLCELLHSMRQPTAGELRQQGSMMVQRLSAELAKLDAALLDSLAEAENSRR